MDCGGNTCRHQLQQRLSALNPAFAERVAALSSSGISSRGAWQRALKAGTAADARKVVQEAREAAEQVGGGHGAGYAEGAAGYRTLAVVSPSVLDHVTVSITNC